MSTTEPPTDGCALPAQPGTPHDGDPLFEAMVFGFTTSGDFWNGESPQHPHDLRTRLADFFEQYLEQQPAPAVGDRVMFSPGGDPARAVRMGAPAWLHGEVTESTPQRIRVAWDATGPHGGNVGTFEPDSFGKLVREPAAARR